MEPLEELGEKGDGGVLRTVKDLTAGAAGGIAQVLLGTFTCAFQFCCLVISLSIGFSSLVRFAYNMTWSVLLSAVSLLSKTPPYSPIT